MYNNAIFIDREKELSDFSHILESSLSNKKIIQICGRGGIGKTKLLHKFIDTLEKNPNHKKRWIYNKEIIDLSLSINQNCEGIFVSVSQALSKFNCFDRFNNKYSSIVDAYEEKGFSYSDYNSIKTIFIEEFNSISKDKNIILFFDSYESTNLSNVRFWTEVFPGLSNTIVFISTRETIQEILIRLDINENKFEQLKGENNFIAETWKLRPFTYKQIIHFFSSHRIDIKPEQAKKIRNISNGVPLNLSLIIDWNNKGNAIWKLFNNFSKKEYDEFLNSIIENNISGDTKEDSIILLMAHLYRRFNNDIYHKFSEFLIDDESFTLNSLKSYSFIKSKETNQPLEETSYYLQDVVAKSIRQSIWPKIDPYFQYRKEISRHVVENYYNTKIQEINNENFPIRTKLHAFEIEKMHYLFDYDWEKAWEYSKSLLAKADLFGDSEVMSSILGGVKKEILSHPIPSNKKEIISLQLNVYEVILLELREDYDKAFDKFSKLQKEYDRHLETFGRRFDLIIAKLLCHGISLSIKLHKNEDKNFSILSSLIKNLDENLGEENKTEEYHNIKRNFNLLKSHQLILRGEYNESLSFLLPIYKSLPQTTIEEDYRRFPATTKLAITLIRDLAYAFYKSGENDTGMFYARKAKGIAENINSYKDIGTSLQLIGRINASESEDDIALGFFNKAKSYFELSHSNEALIELYIDIGKLYRQRGWIISTRTELKNIIDAVPDFSEYNPDHNIQSLEEYSLSNNYFMLAKRLLDETEMGAEKGARLFNEIGCLYRQVFGFDNALVNFQKAVNISKDIKNNYLLTDNLIDAAITYYQKSKLHNFDTNILAGSKEYAITADNLAFENHFFYILSKSRHLLANIALYQKQYSKAISYSIDYCIFLLLQDYKEKAVSDFKAWFSWIFPLITNKYPDHNIDELLNRKLSQTSGITSDQTKKIKEIISRFTEDRLP